MHRLFFNFGLAVVLGYMLPLCIGQQFERPSVDQIFQRFDRNGDGKLTQEEVPPMIWERLSHADTNNDGAVDKKELQDMRSRYMRIRSERNMNKLDQKADQGQSSYKNGDSFKNPKNWSAFDAGQIGGIETKGYFGAAFDGRYVYYAPCRTWDFHGCVLRYDTQKGFNTASSWSSYDAGSTDGLETKGYSDAVFDGRYVYFVPMAVQSTRHARVLRYDTRESFTAATSWSAYDARKIAGSKAMGFVGALFNGRYVYFVPFGYQPYAHGCVLRYDPQGEFKSSNSWSVYDASMTDGLDTKGFYGAAYDGQYIYFVPFNDGREFHGRVLRHDTKKDFKSSSSWSAYDAGKTDGLTTVGYKGAVFDGHYIYFVPFRDGKTPHCRVLRYNTKTEFTAPSSWSAFDAGLTDNLDTRGYVGAAFDKRYIYFVPYSGENQMFHSRFLRYDTEGGFKSSSSWSAFNAGNIDGLTTKGYKFSAYDGTYIYFVPYHNGISFSGIALRFNTKAK